MSSLERNSDWIQTYTGGQFWPLDPRAEDVRIEDIAHSLSLMCRFTGHCKHFYSVAQHSVLVSRVVECNDRISGLDCLAPKETLRIALWGLLHDASEAYMHDLPRPLKRAEGFGELYKKHERRVMRVICEHFGLPIEEPKIVKVVDTVLLLTEQRDLMGRQAKPWKDTAEPLPQPIEPWDSLYAENEFLCRFHDLKEALRG